MPQWNRTIDLADVWKDESRTFEQRRDEIVKRIKESDWRADTPYPHTFDEYLEAVAKTTDPRYFDFEFGRIYDLADEDRVWIETS